MSHIEVIDSKVSVWGGSPAKNAVKTVTCGANAQGIIWVRLLAYPGTGVNTMWNVWINDSSGKNFARWYGSGTTARGRMGTSGTVTVTKTLQGGGYWDSLVVKIVPSANTTQFYFNGEDLGTYSHGTQPSDVVGEIKIERETTACERQHDVPR